MHISVSQLDCDVDMTEDTELRYVFIGAFSQC